MQNMAAAGTATPQEGQFPPGTVDGGAGGGGFDGAYAGPGHAHADGAGTARYSCARPASSRCRVFE